MAVYFPRAQQPYSSIEKKLVADSKGISKNGALGIVFVTNQELQLAQRETLRVAISPLALELIHLERVTMILDRPELAPLRRQFLDIGESAMSIMVGGTGGSAPFAAGGGGGVLVLNQGGVPAGVSLDGTAGSVGAGGGGGGGVIEAGGGGGGGGGGGWGGAGGDGAPARRWVTQEDVAGGMSVSVLLARHAEVVGNDIRQIVDCGWDSLTTSDDLPKDVDLVAVVSIDFGRPVSSTEFMMAFVVENPDGVPVHEHPFTTNSVSAGTRLVIRINYSAICRCSITCPGVWSLSVVSNGLRIHRYNFEVIQKPR